MKPADRRLLLLILVPFLLCGYGVTGLVAYFGHLDSVDAERAAERAKEYRVHQSDVRGTDPATGRPILRCSLCLGTGKAPHFGIRTPEGTPRVDYYVTCPVCDGSGSEVMTEDVFASRRLVIVPDSQETEYSDSRP